MKKSLSILAVFAALLIFAAGCHRVERTKSVEQLYAEACADAAKDADEKDIFPLVNLSLDSKFVTWNETRDKVLLCSWHSFPDSYPEGKEITNSWGVLWLMSEAEMEDWYYKECQNISDSDKPLRFSQLIGLPPTKQHTTITAIWVEPSKVMRPAYETDPTKPMKLAFDEAFLATEKGKSFKEWFDGYAAYAKGEKPYPWTRLGYTYDWSGTGSKYGLTEFVVEKNSTMTVAFTKSNEDYFAWLNSRKNDAK